MAPGMGGSRTKKPSKAASRSRETEATAAPPSWTLTALTPSSDAATGPQRGCRSPPATACA